MKLLEVYDPAMCCSSGVCGPSPDQSLAAFAGAVEKMKAAGVSVKRYNLAQEPLEFASKPEVKVVLESQGQEGLPLVFIDGELRFRGVYPSAEQLAKSLGVKATSSDACCENDECCSESTRKQPITFVKSTVPQQRNPAAVIVQPVVADADQPESPEHD